MKICRTIAACAAAMIFAGCSQAATYNDVVFAEQ